MEVVIEVVVEEVVDKEVTKVVEQVNKGLVKEFNEGSVEVYLCIGQQRGGHLCGG